LSESREVESKLKQKYIRMFRAGFLNDFDKTAGERMTRFDAGTPSQLFGTQVAHLVRRINLLKARLANESQETLAEKSQIPFNAKLLNRDRLLPEFEEQLALQYLYTVLWQGDETTINKELTDLQNWLKHLLSLPGMNLNWLVDWVNGESTLKPVLQSDFWAGTPLPDQASIPPAYTQAGKAKIESVIAEIEAALFDPLIIAARKSDFENWYRGSYFKHWQDFVRAFDGGQKMLRGRDQWQAAAKRIPTPQGAYYALIDRIAAEFEIYETDNHLPSWAGLTFDWQSISKETKDASSPVDLEKSGLIKKAAKKIQGNIRKAEQALGVKVRNPLSAEAQLTSAKAILAYQQALAQTAKGTDSRNVAFTMASDLYKQDPATGESPYFAALKALREIKNLINTAPAPDDLLFWALLEGNIRFMQRYTIQEAACILQERWEKEVLMEVEGVSADRNMAELMMGQGGYAVKFLQGVADPFIMRSIGKGYYPKQVLEQELPFDKNFFIYLTKGARAAKPTQSSYNVKISAFPTDANKEAQLQPHSTLLEYQCSDNKMRLENFNYPVEKSFSWAPAGCGDVLFQIAVGNLLLTRTYTGQNAFPKFLNDFKTGQRVFYRNEFPNEEDALKRIGIEFIKVKYQFQGHDAVLQLLYETPGAAPRRIVPCWER
jgi:type VI secretion system protein ImpL